MSICWWLYTFVVCTLTFGIRRNFSNPRRPSLWREREILINPMIFFCLLTALHDPCRHRSDQGASISTVGRGGPILSSVLCGTCDYLRGALLHAAHCRFVMKKGEKKMQPMIFRMWMKRRYYLLFKKYIYFFKFKLFNILVYCVIKCLSLLLHEYFFYKKNYKRKASVGCQTWSFLIVEQSQQIITIDLNVFKGSVV